MTPRKATVSAAPKLPARSAAILALVLAVLAAPSLKAETSTTYAVGTHPCGVAFDGTNIWVTNEGDNTVTKLLASTGATVGTYPVGNGPCGIAYDGAHIWVANGAPSSNTVTKLLAATGATVGTFPVGKTPLGVAFDGTDVWVANEGDSTVTKLLASTGTALGTYPTGGSAYNSPCCPSTGGGGPTALAFDGTNIWVANEVGGVVTELMASTGAQIGIYLAQYEGRGPSFGVAFDGTDIWVTNQSDNTVARFLASAPYDSPAVFPVGNQPFGIAFDGTNIWVTNVGSGSVTELLASSGATVGTYRVGNNPEGIAFDGTSIWVANLGDNTVTKIRAAGPGYGPSISPAGIVPIDSTVSTIQTGEWVSIYGTNLASSAVSWLGNFPQSLGGTNVMIDGIPAYLSYVSPGQINLQVPNDTSTGPVSVVVTTATGTATSSVTLAPFAPSFLLFDSKHVTGIILRPDGSGSQGTGSDSYDFLGPTGNSLGFPTVAAKAGDTVELFAVGLGPTNPSIKAGQAFSGAAPTINPVNLLINNMSVTPDFAGFDSSILYQINLTVPAGLGTGEVALTATVGGVQTQSGVVISLAGS